MRGYIKPLVYVLLLFTSLWGFTAVAGVEASTQLHKKKPILGTDYQAIPAAKVSASPAAQAWLKADHGKVEVIEFFSYGCPACNLADPGLQAWLKTKPKDVVFRRVPVIFHPEWEVFARTFYALEAMGLEAKLHATLFDALHHRGLNLMSQAAIRDFLVAQSVNGADFDKLFSSFSIANALSNGTALQSAYGIMEVPSLVVNGKYKTNFSLANGNDPRFIYILNEMIKVAKQ
jgi:protein dithiol oxidoreductase (disulfide-forming)